MLSPLRYTSQGCLSVFVSVCVLVYLLLFKYSCLHFPPARPATIPNSYPWSYPSLALSTCLLYMFLNNPSPLCPQYPLPPLLWLRSVDQKTMVHLHNGIRCSRKKEGAPTLCNSMDGSGEYGAKWNKPGGERQIPYDLTYMWNLINETNKQGKYNQRPCN